MNKFVKIPYCLTILPRWVLWAWKDVQGKPTKVPYNPHNPLAEKAATNKPSTWSSFALAEKRLAEHSHWVAGIGFVFTEDMEEHTYCGIDLDKCRNPDTGVIDDWAMAHLREFNTYCEVSPSGTGVKLIVKGKAPAGRKEKDTFNGKEIAREMYSTLRYFTLTGERLDEFSHDVRACQDMIDRFYSTYFKDRPERALMIPQEGTCGNGLEDKELIEIASTKNPKFAALFGGDMSEYHNDHSAADLALCNHLAFWTNKDPVAIDRIFRCSKLNRDKWEDREDYRAATISAALATVETGYVREPVLTLEEIAGITIKEIPAAAPVEVVTPFEAPDDDDEWTSFLTKGKHSLPYNVTEADRTKRKATIRETIKMIPPNGFVADFVKALLPTTDGSPIFGIGTAYAILSTIVNRKVWIYEGGREVYPIMCCLNIGASADRKSTYAKSGIRLLSLSNLEHLILPASITEAALCKRVGDEITKDNITHMKLEYKNRPRTDERGVGLFFYDEFGSLLSACNSQHNSGFKEMLTSSFEGVQYFEKLTSTQGSYLINKPYFPILANSTPDWINDKVTEADIRGGFLGRFTPFISFEKDYNLINCDEPNKAAWERCRGAVERMKGIVGEYTMSSEADEIICTWAKKLKGNDKTQSFVNRFINTAKKMAMLNQIAQNNDKIISADNAHAAVHLLQILFNNLTEFAEMKLSSTPFDAKANKVREYIKKYGFGESGVAHRRVASATKIQAKELSEIIKTLEGAGEIQVIGEKPSSTFYKWLK